MDDRAKKEWRELKTAGLLKKVGLKVAKKNYDHCQSPGCFASSRVEKLYHFGQYLFCEKHATLGQAEADLKAEAKVEYDRIKAESGFGDWG